MWSIWEKGEWCCLNEKGLSWAETLLSLLIVFLLFGSLFPLLQRQHAGLQLKKEEVGAYETLYEAARVLNTGRTAGMRQVEQTVYRWELKGTLCVRYETYRQERKTICAED